MTAPTPPTVVWIVDECAELFERAAHTHHTNGLVHVWSEQLGVSTRADVRDELAGRFTHVLTTVTAPGTAQTPDDVDVARRDLTTLLVFLRDAHRVLCGKPVHP